MLKFLVLFFISFYIWRYAVICNIYIGKYIDDLLPDKNILFCMLSSDFSFHISVSHSHCKWN